MSADLNAFTNDNFECVFVKLSSSTFKTKVLGSVYRPSNSNLDLFMSGFESVLYHFNHFGVECLIVGDFNIDLLKYDAHRGTGSFLDCPHENALMPLITKPTRFTSDFSTLIDNIFTNKPNNLMLSGILLTDISDHLSVFYISVTKNKINVPKFTTISTRSITNQNTLVLKNELTNTDWSSEYNSSNTNTAYDTFLNKFNTIFNKLMPVVNKRVRAYSDAHKPWNSSGLIKYISRKNSLYKNYLKKEKTISIRKIQKA